MCDQEVQSHAFAAETSNVCFAVTVDVDVEGGVCNVL